LNISVKTPKCKWYTTF